MGVLGSPQVAQELARTLHARASDLGSRANQVSSRRAEGWAGSAADRYRCWACSTGRSLEGSASGLHTVADRVRTEADNVQRNINEVRGISGRLLPRIRAWQPTQPGQQPPWAGTRWTPYNLPPGDDPAWRTVARDLAGRI